MTDVELISYVREFRDGLLAGRGSWLAGMMGCAPLATLLDALRDRLGELRRGRLVLTDHESRSRSQRCRQRARNPVDAAVARVRCRPAGWQNDPSR